MQTKQTPMHSGFGPRTTAREALEGIRLDGKVAIVTGGSAGLGLETTRAFSEAGATVIVPARNVAKAKDAVSGMTRVVVEAMDLLDPKSIDSFGQKFAASGRPLHLLINNAGIMATPLERDARGYESQFAANHLGHFQLTARLWPALVKARGARVINLSSRGHQRGGFDLDDLNFEHRSYDRWQGYGQAKTANILFSVELDRRGQKQNVRSFAVHPGAAPSDLAKHLTDEELAVFGMDRDNLSAIPAGKSVDEGGELKSHEQGAATTVWCATSPRLEGMGGLYCMDCDIAPLLPDGAPGNAGVRPYAVDPAAAKKLWIISERLTGVTFPAGML